MYTALTSQGMMSYMLRVCLHTFLWARCKNLWVSSQTRCGDVPNPSGEGNTSLKERWHVVALCLKVKLFSSFWVVTEMCGLQNGLI